MFMYVEIVQECSNLMPKVKQKTSARRGQPSSFSDSDSELKAVDKRKGGKARQENKFWKAAERNSDVDSDDEIPAFPATRKTASTQLSGSHSEKHFAQMSVQDRERIAVDIVHYLLTADYKKHPIKQSDIKKHALGDYSRAFNSLMRMATEKLRNVYGIKVVETEVRKQKAYMLINAFDNKCRAAHQTWSPEDYANMGLVMVILSAIFMKGNALREEDLYDLLNRLGIDPDRPDETYGDIKHLIMTDFVHQGYLEVEREPDSDPPVHVFRWGPRARAETSKQKAMKFLCQVFKKSSERWTTLMRDVEQRQAADRYAASKSDRPSCSRRST